MQCLTLATNLSTCVQNTCSLWCRRDINCKYAIFQSVSCLSPANTCNARCTYLVKQLNLFSATITLFSGYILHDVAHHESSSRALLLLYTYAQCHCKVHPPPPHPPPPQDILIASAFLWYIVKLKSTHGKLSCHYNIVQLSLATANILPLNPVG